MANVLERAKETIRRVTGEVNEAPIAYTGLSLVVGSMVHAVVLSFPVNAEAVEIARSQGYTSGYESVKKKSEIAQTLYVTKYRNVTVLEIAGLVGGVVLALGGAAYTGRGRQRFSAA